MFQRYDAQTTSTSQRFKKKLESFSPGSWSPSRYAYIVYAQPNIYPKISRYIYIEQIYTQARRLDSYNFLFYNDILFGELNYRWKFQFIRPLPGRHLMVGASGSAVRKWSWVGWIWLNRQSRFETSSSQTWALGDPQFVFCVQVCFFFLPSFFDMVLVTKKEGWSGSVLLKAMLSSLLSKELDLFLSETLLTTKRTFPRTDGWLVMMDKILLRIFEVPFIL